MFHEYFLIVTMFCFSWSLELLLFFGCCWYSFLCLYHCLYPQLSKRTIKSFQRVFSHNPLGQVVCQGISLSVPVVVTLLLSLDWWHVRLNTQASSSIYLYPSPMLDSLFLTLLFSTFLVYCLFDATHF